jgi:hypothetical protein
MQFKNISLQQFGRLMPSFPMGYIGGRIAWMCLCDCGTMKVVISANLTRGLTKSCGCLQRELAAVRGRISMAQRTGEKNPAFKHGHCLRLRHSITYTSWTNTIQRCTDSKHPGWSHYGGANPPVTVCEQWQGEHGFEHFLSDMGERPSKRHSLGRFGDVGNYEKSNCAWQTWKQQGLEKKIKHWNQKLSAVAA